MGFLPEDDTKKTSVIIVLAVVTAFIVLTLSVTANYITIKIIDGPAAPKEVEKTTITTTEKVIP